MHWLTWAETTRLAGKPIWRGLLPTRCWATCGPWFWRRTNRSIARANDLRRNAGQRRSVVWLLFVVSLSIGIGISVLTVRWVDRPLRRLIGAADRFGAGDLRRVQLGKMPIELERLARAMDGMASRLRSVLVSVVGEASQIGNRATDFSAMSEELAASAAARSRLP